MTDYTMNQDRCKFTPDEFKKVVAEYLDERVSQGKIPGVYSFAMFADVSREQLYKKYAVDPEYKDAFDRLIRVRNGMTEDELLNPSEERKRSDARIIFAAKDFLGMTEKQEINHTSSDGSMSPKGKTLDDFYESGD